MSINGQTSSNALLLSYMSSTLYNNSSRNLLFLLLLLMYTCTSIVQADSCVVVEQPKNKFDTNHWFHMSEFFLAKNGLIDDWLKPNDNYVLLAPSQRFVTQLTPMTMFLLMISFTDGNPKAFQVVYSPEVVQTIAAAAAPVATPTSSEAVSAGEINALAAAASTVAPGSYQLMGLRYVYRRSSVGIGYDPNHVSKGQHNEQGRFYFVSGPDPAAATAYAATITTTATNTIGPADSSSSSSSSDISDSGSVSCDRVHPQGIGSENYPVFNWFTSTVNTDPATGPTIAVTDPQQQRHRQRVLQHGKDKNNNIMGNTRTNNSSNDSSSSSNSNNAGQRARLSRLRSKIRRMCGLGTSVEVGAGINRFEAELRDNPFLSHHSTVSVSVEVPVGPGVPISRSLGVQNSGTTATTTASTAAPSRKRIIKQKLVAYQRNSNRRFVDLEDQLKAIRAKLLDPGYARLMQHSWQLHTTSSSATEIKDQTASASLSRHATDSGSSTADNVVVVAETAATKDIDMEMEIEVQWDLYILKHDDALLPCSMAAIFQQTDILLTSHGFQEIGILFLRPGSTLIEVFPYRYFKPTYQLFAKQLGIHSFFLENDAPTSVKSAILRLVPNAEYCMQFLRCRGYARSDDVILRPSDVGFIVQKMVTISVTDMHNRLV